MVRTVNGPTPAECSYKFAYSTALAQILEPGIVLFLGRQPSKGLFDFKANFLHRGRARLLVLIHLEQMYAARTIEDFADTPRRQRERRLFERFDQVSLT